MIEHGTGRLGCASIGYLAVALSESNDGMKNKFVSHRGLHECRDLGIERIPLDQTRDGDRGDVDKH